VLVHDLVHTVKSNLLYKPIMTLLYYDMIHMILSVVGAGAEAEPYWKNLPSGRWWVWNNFWLLVV